MDFQPSITEKHGLDLLGPKAKDILSIGISTGGSAELQMAKKCPLAKIIATTIDVKGLELTKAIIAKSPNKNQIICKSENCGKVWEYGDNTFDFIYARLVFHYLTKDELKIALNEIHRTLKDTGKAFIVVRSIDEPELKRPDIKYDDVTGFITYADFLDKVQSRQFFSEKSLRDVLENAKLKPQYIKTTQEQLFQDYERKLKNPNMNTLIETVVKKSVLL
ncbi:MAG: class I SAM-dependent methyltransferase [Christensenellaceae bacterium]|jgi:predicted SAM-dependent methyltransferase|nr:class I SAM-dependent methyltransferase [Christensenellaceae bacterium]